MSFITNGFPDLTFSVSPNFNIDEHLFMYPRLDLALDRAKKIISDDNTKYVLIEVYPAVYTEDIILTDNIIIAFKPGAFMRGDVNNLDHPILTVTGNPCMVSDFFYHFPEIPDCDSMKKFAIEIKDGALGLFKNTIISYGIRDTPVVIRKGGGCYFEGGIIWAGQKTGLSDSYYASIAAEGAMPSSKRVFSNMYIEGMAHWIYIFQPEVPESGTALIIRGVTSYASNLVFPDDDENILTVKSEHSGIWYGYLKETNEWKDHMNLEGINSLGLGSKPETLSGKTIFNKEDITVDTENWVEVDLSPDDPVSGQIDDNNIPPPVRGIFLNVHMERNTEAGEDIKFQLSNKSDHEDYEIVNSFLPGLKRDCQFPLQLTQKKLYYKVSGMSETEGRNLSVTLTLLGWNFGGL